MKEIKATDLMLGNWFIGYDGKPFQWKGCHFEIIENEVECISIDELIKSPIPLTEERLLKCGFIVKYWSNQGFAMKHEDIMEIQWRKQINSTNLLYRNKSIEHIEYLHQLQNLFKILTGNDLKISL